MKTILISLAAVIAVAIVVMIVANVVIVGHACRVVSRSCEQFKEIERDSKDEK